MPLSLDSPKSWFGRLWPRAEQKSFSGILDMFRFGQASAAGPVVNAEIALAVPTVLACCRVIAEGLAQVPWRLYRRTSPDGREIETHHPAAQIIVQPNPFQTSFELRETMAFHAALTGNAYVQIVRDLDGQPVELLPWLPNLVTVRQDRDWQVSYHIQTAGKTLILPASDMWHFKGPSWTSTAGIAIYDAARNAIGLAIAAERFGSQFFANGARPSGIITPEPGVSLSTEQIAAAREEWLAIHGNGNQQGVAFLNRLQYKPISTRPDEAQFSEVRQMQVVEICRAFRVNPAMVMVGGTTTYASAEQMFLAHLTHTLGPWFARFTQSAERALLSADDVRAGLHFLLDDKGLLRGSARDRAEYHALALQHGWEAVDEVRAVEGLPPLGGSFSLPKPAANLYGTD